MVAAVEGLDTAVAGKVKKRVLRGALKAGVADYLHGQVKKMGIPKKMMSNFRH
jgi:hypothetical protein